MRNKFFSLTGILIIAVMVLAVNLIASLTLHRARFDMTQDKLYTLSPGTRQILGGLKDDVKARLYFSKTALNEAAAPLKMYGDRVVEILQEYAYNSNGKFALEILDPRPDTEEEEWAERYGLQGVPDANNNRLYLGLVLKDESNNEQVIPFFHPGKEQALEYDLSNALYNLSHPEKKKIAFISGINISGKSATPMMMQQSSAERPWAIYQELKKTYDITDLGQNATEVPKEIDLLLLVHPKKLSASAQYAIDQFVLRGGKVLAFVDPFSIADQGSMQNVPAQARMQMPISSNLPELFKSWGIEMEAGEAPDVMAMGGMGNGKGMKVVMDPNTAYREEGQSQPIFLNFGADNRNASEIITNGLENMLFAAAGSLKKTSGTLNLQVTPLFETSDRGIVVEDMMLKMGADPAELLKTDSTKGTQGKKMVACKITGKFNTAFPSGKPVEPIKDEQTGEVKEPAGNTPDPNQLKESKTDGVVIVVADVDVISDQFSVIKKNLGPYEMVSQRNNNLTFALNTVENLTGSNDLIGLRSRGRFQRPFTRVQELTNAAEAKWLNEEEALRKTLQESEDTLNKLLQGGKNKQILDQEIVKKVDKLRAEKAKTQEKLREVRRNLREDVEKLSFEVKFINIALIPMLVVFASIAIFIVRVMRKKQR